MRSIKTIGLVIVAVLAFSAVAASAASAEEFVASKTGELKSKALNVQLFKTGNGATVECTEATGTGKVEELKSLTFTISVLYGKCTVGGVVKATVTLAEYLFMAGPPFVKLLNSVTITTTTDKCKILVDPAGNEKLEKIVYKNNGGKVVEETEVSGITSDTVEGTESVCGKLGESKVGTYTGNNEAELVGGTIEVK